LEKVSFLKNLKTFKYEMIIPFPVEKVISSLHPQYEVEIFDPNVVKFEIVKYLSNEELRKTHKMKSNRSSLVLETTLKFPFPLTDNRKNIVVTSCQYDPEKKLFYQVAKPCLHARDKNLKYFKNQKGIFYENKTQKKENSKFFYIFSYFFNAYQKLDENRTLFSQVIMSDLGVPQKNFIFKMVIGKRANEMRREYINHIISKKENFDKNLFSNDPNGKQYLELEIEKQDEEYEKLFIKKVVDKKENFQIEMQEMKKMNLEIYHDENGDFKIELIDFKSINDEEFEFILYNICLLNDKESFLKISKEEKFNIDIQFKNYQMISLLHLCAKSNSLDIFQILLEMGILYFNL
jgi:hypothetical protein